MHPYIPYLPLTNSRIAVFFSFQDLRKLREAAKMKRYAARLEREGLQDLELAMISTPVSQPVDLVSAGVHKAGRLAPPSPSASLPTVEVQQVPSPLGPIPKRSHHAPTASTSGALRKEDVPLQEVPLPMGPSEPIAGPTGSSQLPLELQGSPPVPCHIPQLALPARSSK